MRELTLLVEQHRSFPSIYTWVIYNEGWGQLLSAPEVQLTPYVRSLDPTRLIDSTTGWNTFGFNVSDYSDNHHVRLQLFNKRNHSFISCSTLPRNAAHPGTPSLRARMIPTKSASKANSAGSG